MEAKIVTTRPLNGQFIFVDSYGTIYLTKWSTAGGLFDITTVTMQPYVWGDDQTPKEPNIVGNQVYVRGIITTTRQLFGPDPSGYIILSEGTEQRIDTFPINFPPGTEQPVDPFLYHLDNSVTDEVDVEVTDGPRWADPNNSNDGALTWANFKFVDVWAENQ